MKKIISTPNAPSAIGPYSQAIQFNNILVTSGIIPIEPISGDLITGTVVEQTTQVLKNLKALLEDAGSSLDNVIKTTLYIKNMEDFTKINEVYSSFFVNSYPARSCVEVARLPKDVLLEVEAIAYID